MTEALLERIVVTGSEIVLLDITGVPVVDTAVARHPLRNRGCRPTPGSGRLDRRSLLADGDDARPAGIDLTHVTTRATLAKGLEFAFQAAGISRCRAERERSAYGRPVDGAMP